jgi:hypothetical protein
VGRRSAGGVGRVPPPCNAGPMAQSARRTRWPVWTRRRVRASWRSASTRRLVLSVDLHHTQDPGLDHDGSRRCASSDPPDCSLAGRSPVPLQLGTLVAADGAESANSPHKVSSRPRTPNYCQRRRISVFAGQIGLLSEVQRWPTSTADRLPTSPGTTEVLSLPGRS